MNKIITLVVLVLVFTSCNNKKTDTTATAQSTEVAMQEATENLHQF